MKSVWLLSGQDGRPWFMYCTRCNKVFVFVFVFDQDVGDVTKDRTGPKGGRYDSKCLVNSELRQRHRYISITPRKNTELLLILLVVTRHNYWIVTLFSMHFVKSVWLLSGQDGRPWFMYCARCNKVFIFDQDVGDVTKDRSDGRPVWLEMPRQQRHRHISITPRKNTELLLILLVVTRNNYWIVTLFSMHSNISFSVKSAATFETLNVMFCRWGFPRCQLSLRPIQLAAASGPHPMSGTALSPPSYILSSCRKSIFIYIIILSGKCI